jgi:hypothetical protein
MSFVDVRDFAGAVVGDDWAPAFKLAISAAVQGGHGGVVVPTIGAPYTVRKPAGPQQQPSIDLRGLHQFTLLGEGDRSVITMVGSGSWQMIHIGGQATDVQVRDLSLNAAELEETDEHAHLIVVGTSNSIPGGARHVSIVNCTLARAAGDAVAIVPGSSNEPSEEVSDITITRCRLLDNGRSGVSNQRLAKQISILHNYFAGNSDQDIDFEPTGDLPGSGPSGYLILGNTMVRNGHSDAVSVTLSGTSPESPSRQNTFAYNQIYGGRLGLHDAQDISIVGNYIEDGPGQPETLVRMGDAVERLLFAGNIVVRPRNASPGTLLNVSSEPTTWAFTAKDVNVATDTLRRTGHGLQTGVGPLRAFTASTPNGVANALPTGLVAGVDYWAIRVDRDHFQLAVGHEEAQAGQAIDLQDAGSGTFQLTRTGFPRSVCIQGNRLSTEVPVPEGEALVTFTNASAVSFCDNELASFAGADLDVAVTFNRTPVRKRPLVGWEVVGNRFRGDAHLPPEFDEAGVGSFGVAVSMAAAQDTVRDVRVSENTFAGCKTQVRLSADSPAAFATIPAVMGNIGVGTALVVESQATIPAVLVGGNQQSADGTGETGTPLAPAGARYCGAGRPTFAAPIGSLYSRTDGVPGQLLFVNTDGLSAWTAIA